MLPTNALIIHFEGAPRHLAFEIAGAREYLADVLEEDGECFSVWEVFSDDRESIDMSVRFARDWSQDLGFGDGDDPAEFLKPFTGYVLAHLRDELIAEYRKAQEAAYG